MLRPDAGISAILKQRADVEDRNFERASDRERRILDMPSNSFDQARSRASILDFVDAITREHDIVSSNSS